LKKVKKSKVKRIKSKVFSKPKTSKEGKILLVKKIYKDAILPESAMSTDAGIDLRANESVDLDPMEQKHVKTGLILKIPDGCVGLIRDRAGLVSKMNVYTAAGTFDPAYRGEVSVLLVNFGDVSVTIDKGMRIAQLIIMPVIKAKIKEVKQLSTTARNDRGFGSTGMH